jgi:large subunit ribosomal protein L35
MPKQKTHKGILKRVKIGRKGKIKCRQVGRGHLLAHKSANRKRRLRRTGVLAKAEQKKVYRLAFGHR